MCVCILGEGGGWVSTCLLAKWCMECLKEIESASDIVSFLTVCVNGDVVTQFVQDPRVHWERAWLKRVAIVHVRQSA